MGEASEWLFEPEFNRAIKVCEQDQRITSDAGVLLLREADHRLGLVSNSRMGKKACKTVDNCDRSS